MITYLDTSALVKRYVNESGSQDLAAAWPSFTVIGSAVIVRVEIAAALTKAERSGWLEKDGCQRAWQAFLEDWQRLTLVNISLSVVYRASDLAWEHGLRGYDAVHLAAALTWQEGLLSTVQFCTFDRRLWEAANKVHISLWPESLDSLQSLHKPVS